MVSNQLLLHLGAAITALEYIFITPLGTTLGICRIIPQRSVNNLLNSHLWHDCCYLISD